MAVSVPSALVAAFICLLASVSESAASSGAAAVPSSGPAGPSSSRPRPGTKAPACAGAPVVVEVVAGNRTVAAFWGLEAAFGSSIPPNGTGLIPLDAAVPHDACGALEDVSTGNGGAPGFLVNRGNCSFTDKAANVMGAASSLMLVASNDTECLGMGGAAAEDLQNYTGLWAAGLPSDVAEKLSALLENATAEELSVVVWGVSARMDHLSSALLWAIAVGTVVSGSLWSSHDLLVSEKLKGRGSAPGQQRAQQELAVASEPLTALHALIFLGASSTALVILFFLVGWVLVLVLVAMFALLGWQALAALLSPVAAALCGPSLASRAVVLPCGLGATAASDLMAAVAAGAAAAVWVPFRNSGWAWVLQDLLGVSVCVLFLRVIHLPNLKVAMILLPLMFAYDVFWVFLEPLIFGGPSVMVKVATGGSSHEVMPMVLRVPYLTLDLQGTAILGLGDIVLPGLLVAFSRGVDALRGTRLSRGYFLPVAVGYGVGLILTYLALEFEIGGSSGQPALLYLVPCTLGTITVAALLRGDLRNLMATNRGGENQRIREDEESPPNRLATDDGGDGNEDEEEAAETTNLLEPRA